MKDWAWRVRSASSTRNLLAPSFQNIVGAITDCWSIGEDFPKESPYLWPSPEHPLASKSAKHEHRSSDETSSDSMFPDSRDEMLPGES